MLSFTASVDAAKHWGQAKHGPHLHVLFDTQLLCYCCRVGMAVGQSVLLLTSKNTAAVVFPTPPCRVSRQRRSLCCTEQQTI